MLPLSGLPLPTCPHLVLPLVLPLPPPNPLPPELGLLGENAALRRRRHLDATFLPVTSDHHLAVVGAAAAAEGRRDRPGPTSSTTSGPRTLQLTCKTPGTWLLPGIVGHLVTSGERRSVASHQHSQSCCWATSAAVSCWATS